MVMYDLGMHKVIGITKHYNYLLCIIMNFKDKHMLITLWVNLNDNNNEICMNEAGPTHALYIPI